MILGASDSEEDADDLGRELTLIGVLADGFGSAEELCDVHGAEEVGRLRPCTYYTQSIRPHKDYVTLFLRSVPVVC